jgi:hypothetical protein
MVPYTIAGAVLYALDRLFRIVSINWRFNSAYIRYIWGTLPQKTTMLAVKDDEEKLVQLRFKKHELAKYLNLYKVAQYYFINIPGVSLLQWHPYSASSGPDEDTIEIHIKGTRHH